MTNIRDKLWSIETFRAEFDKINQRHNGALSLMTELDIPFVARERELRLVKNIMEKQDYCNALLLAGAGEGKSTLVRELVRKLNRGEFENSLNRKYIILELKLPKLSGVGQEQIKERLSTLLDTTAQLETLAQKELQDDTVRFILFVDEIQQILQMVDGNQKAGMDTLKDALMGKKALVICATTEDEYRKSLSLDQPFVERFNRVKFDSFKESQLIEICTSLWQKMTQEIEYRFYWDSHSRLLSKTLVKEMLRTNQRLFPQNFEPRRTVKTLIELEQYARSEDRPPTHDLYVKMLWDMHKVTPQVQIDVRVTLDEIDKTLIGQDMAKKRLSRILKDVGFNNDLERGAVLKLLFLGPSGVGKTETVRCLNRKLYGEDYDPHKNPPFNMSIYAEQDDGAIQLLRDIGQRLENNPNSIILLDEFEKGIPSKNRTVKSNLMNVFLSVFDSEGHLTYTVKDAQGRDLQKTVSTSSACFILTSNAGFKAIESENKNTDEINLLNNLVKITDYNRRIDTVKSWLISSEGVSPEFFGRLDGVVLYDKLNNYETIQLSDRLIESYKRHLIINKRITLETNFSCEYREFEVEDVPREKFYLSENKEKLVELNDMAVYIGYVRSNERQEGSGGAREVRRNFITYFREPISEFCLDNPDVKKIKVEIENRGLLSQEQSLETLGVVISAG